MTTHHKGNHTFGDFVWDVDLLNINHNEVAENIFQIMKNAIAKTKMTVVHTQLVILGQTPTSPAGFTSVILIDESHITSHCYSEKGLLALDVFTCGDTDPQLIMTNIEQEIKLLYPTFRCVYNDTHKRFNY